jgi:hypothetical protein
MPQTLTLMDFDKHFAMASCVLLFVQFEEVLVSFMDLFFCLHVIREFDFRINAVNTILQTSCDPFSWIPVQYKQNTVC